MISNRGSFVVTYGFRSKLLHLLQWIRQDRKRTTQREAAKARRFGGSLPGEVEDGHTSIDWQLWPEVEYPDIYNFLIAAPSLYTGDSLKAYKSLDAYNYYTSGWIDNVMVFTIPSCPGTYLITARVKHSQKLSATPVKPWVAVEQQGMVVCACTLHLYGRFRRSMLTHSSPPVYSRGKHSSKKENSMYLSAMLMASSNFS